MSHNKQEHVKLRQCNSCIEFDNYILSSIVDFMRKKLILTKLFSEYI